MIFSSVIFLFLFLPITLALYAVAGSKFRNALLLLASLVFYAWGEGVYTLIMLVSITVNYFVGIGIDHFRGRTSAKIFLVLGIVFNILLLSAFKNTEFIKQLVQRGDGTSMVVKEAVAVELGEKKLVQLPLKSPKIYLDVSIAYLKNQALSLPAEAFVDTLTKLKSEDIDPMVSVP
jgi:D-alanyl-lipoteichoic acid acyltransferase DltB (MBOAT superfamily)